MGKSYSRGNFTCKKVSSGGGGRMKNQVTNSGGLMLMRLKVFESY